MRRKICVLIIGCLTAALLLTAPPASARPPATSGPTVYTGSLTADQLRHLTALGLDHESLTITGRAGDRSAVEVILTREQAARLTAAGLVMAEKKIGGATATQRMRQSTSAAAGVFRSYSAPGGIRDELIELSRQYPGLTKLQSIGRTVRGQDILAIKVTADARQVRDGRRPSVLYVGAQHAREWITPEMNRRLLRHVLQGYATDAATRRLVNSTELWFVPVANPDGYDYTFTEDHRLWRKNLRDNDGDGVITGLDGVDPNRNFAYRWGYDNEGSSPSIGSETYRGSGPNSEPETKALDGLMKRIGFRFLVNYHSAAELLLYGVGYQVATPSPDDVIQQAMVGDDAHPAVPGYDPDLSAELYTTNGETDGHAHEKYGVLGFTPEMSTCATASAADPDDAFDPADCVSGFNFPDSEPLIQAEFAKNLPFALSVARSAVDPDDPVSVLGTTTPDFVPDSFAVSYGDPQPVAVTARRDLRNLSMSYSINGRRAVNVGVREWRGGERYGRDGTVYYAEYRGVVRGARPGDQVRVWFIGDRRGQGRRTSEAFTYRLAQDTRHRVLVVANEDYEGVNPTYPPTVTGPKYAAAHVAALRDAGYRASLWDVSKQGVPHHLGVLGHFDAVLWYLGDNRLTQDPEDEVTEIFGGPYRDAAVAERQQYLTMSIRDFLNEGGKLVHAGETAGYLGTLSGVLGGIFYGLGSDPAADCVVVSDLSECLILADDFYQYYLGAFSRSSVPSPRAFTGAGRLAGTGGVFGGPAVVDNPLNEPGTFTSTSDVLPATDFPLFASEAGGRYTGSAGGAFDPIEGSWYAAAAHLDSSYTRLTRVIDLTGTTAAQSPQLSAKISFDTEPGYDNVIVEAHPVGSEAWTTLPEAGGLTTTTPPTECEAGFYIREHPFLNHYLTAGDPCKNSGTTGAWNAMTGNSGGWTSARFDLSAYAGRQVELSIAYVTDPGSGGAGVVVDDTAVVIGGQATQSAGFETTLAPWTVTGPPAGSPPGGTVFKRSQGLFSAAVTTRDTVLLGFGLEQIASPTERAEVVKVALDRLLRRRH